MKARAESADPLAIDGPSASGKSTVARRVATELGRIYVDSGSVYRAITWLALQEGVNTSDNDALARMIDAASVEFPVRNGAVRVTVNGREAGPEIRSAEVNAHVSPVSAQVDVRKRVVAWLRRLSDLGPLVMEGRDIGTAVFPGTPLKFYLDASLEERVRRRQAEEGAASAGNVGESISRRDRIDSSRSVAPLKAASDAVIVDSTAMSIPEVAETILRVVRERIAV